MQTWNWASCKTKLNSASRLLKQEINVSGTKFPPNLPNFPLHPFLSWSVSSTSCGFGNVGLLIIKLLVELIMPLTKVLWSTITARTTEALPILLLTLTCPLVGHIWEIRRPVRILQAIYIICLCKGERERERERERVIFGCLLILVGTFCEFFFIEVLFSDKSKVVNKYCTQNDHENEEHEEVLWKKEVRWCLIRRDTVAPSGGIKAKAGRKYTLLHVYVSLLSHLMGPTSCRYH